MYQKLKSWSKHNNRELLHLGTAAMEAFLTQVRTFTWEKPWANTWITILLKTDSLNYQGKICFYVIYYAYSELKLPWEGFYSRFTGINFFWSSDIWSAGCKSKRGEKRRSNVQGFLCLETFVALNINCQIVYCCLSNAIFFLSQFFVTKFKEIMDDSSASAKEMSLAIRGYGLLAAVSAHFLLLHCTYSIVLNGVGSDEQFLKIK